MIIEAQNFNPYIYYQEPNTEENGIVLYGIRKDIYALNITPEIIPDDLKISLTMLGEDKGSGPYGNGAMFCIELQDNIFLDFQDKHTVILYYKALLKIKGFEPQSIKDIYPEMFI